MRKWRETRSVSSQLLSLSKITIIQFQEVNYNQAIRKITSTQLKYSKGKTVAKEVSQMNRAKVNWLLLSQKDHRIRLISAKLRIRPCSRTKTLRIMLYLETVEVLSSVTASKMQELLKMLLSIHLQMLLKRKVSRRKAPRFQQDPQLLLTQEKNSTTVTTRSLTGSKSSCKRKWWVNHRQSLRASSINLWTKPLTKMDIKYRFQKDIKTFCSISFAFLWLTHSTLRFQTLWVREIQITTQSQ